MRNVSNCTQKIKCNCSQFQRHTEEHMWKYCILFSHGCFEITPFAIIYFPATKLTSCVRHIFTSDTNFKLAYYLFIAAFTTMPLRKDGQISGKIQWLSNRHYCNEPYSVFGNKCPSACNDIAAATSHAITASGLCNNLIAWDAQMKLFQD